MMRAAMIDVPGPAESIRVRQVPVPVPAPGEVLVRVDYSCVNHVDVYVRSGAYATALPSPFIIGRDLVGTVQGPAQGVDTVRPGERVWANSMGYDGRQGSLSQYCAVPAERLFKVPASVSDPRDVVALSHGMTTAWLGLGRTAPLAAGQRVFIGGAAGVVGSAAVQLAVAHGARVLASAAPADHDWVRALGAEVVTDYAAEDLPEMVAAHAPDGVDIWWDTSGHQHLPQVLPLLAHGGRVLISAGLHNDLELQAGALYTRDASLLGFAVSGADAADLAAAARELNKLLATRSLDYRVDSELELEQAAAAHQLVESGRPRGKVLVRID